MKEHKILEDIYFINKSLLQKEGRGHYKRWNQKTYTMQEVVEASMPQQQML